MHEIVVISGKGGTGKTSVCAAFAHLMDNGIICDLDVDAPDLHIILDPKPRSEHAFISGHEAVIDQEICTRCGSCYEACRFEGIFRNTDNYTVDPLRCEGCGVCGAICPAGAVTLADKHCGDWYESDTRFGIMLHAQLFPGEENSGRLVSLLKQKARERAKAEGKDIILCDGSPGIGCPVISSLSGADMAVAVVEPTPSGRHDFIRVADLCDHFRIPVSVILNKADLNREECAAIRAACAERGYSEAGEIPFTQDITTAMIGRQALTETGSAQAARLRDAWADITDRVKTGSRKRSPF